MPSNTIETVNLANLLSISDYARKKKVARRAVYRKIRNKSIIPTIIGPKGMQHTFIDWVAYQGVTFITK